MNSQPNHRRRGRYDSQRPTNTKKMKLFWKETTTENSARQEFELLMKIDHGHYIDYYVVFWTGCWSALDAHKLQILQCDN